jgi:hypothetical protein
MNEAGQRAALMQKIRNVCQIHIPNSEFANRFAASVEDIPQMIENGSHYTFVFRDHPNHDVKFVNNKEHFFRDFAEAVCGGIPPENVNKTYVMYQSQGYKKKNLKCYEWNVGDLSFAFHHPSPIEASRLNVYSAWTLDVRTPQEKDLDSDAETDEGTSDSDDDPWGDSLRRFELVSTGPSSQRARPSGRWGQG